VATRESPGFSPGFFGFNGAMPETTPNAPTVSDSEAKTWAVLVHVGGIFFFFLPSLVALVLCEGRSAVVSREARAALNFQLTVLIGYLVGFFTLWILVGFVVLLAVVVLNAVFCIMAAVEAARGEKATYLMSIPFVRA
jgi:uncharacterized Tic20 family protein